jgi:integrase
MPLTHNHKVKLTKRVVESLEPNPTKRIEIWDTDVTGFYVRVYPTGKKTYFLQFRNKDRESRKIKIGVHGSITTELAREQAIHLSLEVGAGRDPSIKIVVQEVASHTMTELGEKYLALHASIKKKQKGYKEDTASIQNIIGKKFGHLSVTAVTTLDLQKLHAELKDTPYKANRLRSLLSKMFTLAIKWGWRLDNPVKGVEKYQEYKRHRWLNNEEVQTLWAVLETYHNQNVADAIRLLLLTGSRRNEVLHATWDQFDLDKGVWTKPAHTTKQKKMEHLPLSALALEMLEDMKMNSESPFLFPGKILGKPLQEIKKAWDTIRKRAGFPDLRLHDLRHTHASHLVSSGLSLSIVGKLLGHTQAATTQRYAHLADEPLRQATEVFGNKLKQLIGAAVVEQR